MKRGLRIAGKAAVLILVGLLFRFGIRCYENLKQFDGQAGFYNTQEQFTRAQMEDFWKAATEDAKRELQGLVLFRTEPGVEVRNESLNRTAEAELLEAAGTMYLITPGKLMQGSFVTDSDRSGCVISQKTSEQLFGDQDVIGEELTIGRKQYTVRGIVAIGKPFCMIQGDTEKSYPYIRIDAPYVPLSVARQMLAGLLPETSGWMSEGNLYYGLGSITFWIPAWLLLCMGIWKGRKEVRSVSKKALHTILNILLPVVGFACLCALGFLSFRFSDDYIPNMWSDFEFWAELIRQKQEMTAVLLEQPLQIADVVMLQNLVGVMIFAIGAVFCVVAGCRLRGNRFGKFYLHNGKR